MEKCYASILRATSAIIPKMFEIIISKFYSFKPQYTQAHTKTGKILPKFTASSKN